METIRPILTYTVGLDKDGGIKLQVVRHGLDPHQVLACAGAVAANAFMAAAAALQTPVRPPIEPGRN